MKKLGSFANPIFLLYLYRINLSRGQKRSTAIIELLLRAFVLPESFLNNPGLVLFHKLKELFIKVNVYNWHVRAEDFYLYKYIGSPKHIFQHRNVYI